MGNKNEYGFPLKTCGNDKVLNAFILILCLLLSGCGYQNLSRASFYRSVYFPILTNRTMQPGAEVTLTNAITEELLRSGIVLTGKEPEYLLSGVVTSYQRTALSFSSVDPKEVSQYRLAVIIHLKLEEFISSTPPLIPLNPPLQKGEEGGFSLDLKISQVDLTTSTDYYLTGPFAKKETEAFGIVADDLAKRATEWLNEK
ncbi:MAG: LPS assembly lipoprotein LptE [Candidatus Omnitrophota bacterium]